MSNGDYTRFTHVPQKRYAGVLMQQGRVQLDADWNEQIEIGQRRWQLQAVDTFGPCAVPRATTPHGFEITAVGGPPPDLQLGVGRMYVEGILAEIFPGETFTYLHQLFYPVPPPLATLSGPNGICYLDVWEREITAIEDPDLLEKALEGPDTTTRLQTVWQVKVHGMGEGLVTCETDLNALFPPSGGQLSTRAIAPPPVDDPCILPPSGGYRGLENRLYRVEVHVAGDLATARFKWSRENASVVSAVEHIDASGSQSVLTVSRIGRDKILRFQVDDWVEVLDDDRELMGEPGDMARVTLVDEANRTLTLDRTIPAAGNRAFGATDQELRERHTRVRRWDQQHDVDANGLVAVSNTWLPLEDGAEVMFALASATTTFHVGDYWVFAARTVDGSVETLVNAPPRGIVHHYCQLATLTGMGPETTGTVHDCRHLWPPQTGQSCCTVTVGDGVRSVGDFTDIQAAIDSLEHGGRVCILSGEYLLRDTVVIRRNDVIVSGCGRQTHIGGLGERQTQPGFLVENCTRVAIESLFIEVLNQDGAILVRNIDTVRVADCLLHNRRGPALRVSESARITVEGSTCQGLSPAISIQAQEVRVADNRLEDAGLWLRDGSSDVLIQGNVIVDGRGPGIILGGLEAEEQPSDQVTGIAVVGITGNHISGMRNSGVSTMVGRDAAASALGAIEDITITENRIVACARQGPNSLLEAEAVGGIVLRDVARLRIHHNYIADNGTTPPVPACGLFLTLCQGLEITDNTIVNNGAPPTEVRQCIDFRTMQPGTGPNPRTERGTSFTVQEPSTAQTRIMTSGSFTGLDCGRQLEIALSSPTTRVELTLVHTAVPARIAAFNANGTSAGTASMSGPPQQAETLSLTGTAIQRVVVTAPQNETLLLEFCVAVEEPITSYQGGIIVLFVSGDPLQVTGSTDPAVAPQGRFQAGASAAMIHDNVVVCPRGQALLVVGLGALSVADNTLTSQGIRDQPESIVGARIGFQTQIGRCVSIYNLGRTRLLPTAVAGLRGNVRTHLEFTGIASPETLHLMPGVFQQELPDGRVLFHSNQVTLQVAGQISEPLLRAAVALISLDDVSLQDNQLLAEAASEMLFTNVLAYSPTLRASGNRFTELPLRALYSYYSLGQSSNIATNNQATHCIFVGGAQPIVAQNYEMFTVNCQRLNGFLSELGLLARS
jgi:hypothetical protein